VLLQFPRLYRDLEVFLAQDFHLLRGFQTDQVGDNGRRLSPDLLLELSDGKFQAGDYINGAFQVELLSQLAQEAQGKIESLSNS
jgi:hypothetical protein